jgi:hypothetical protein
MKPFSADVLRLKLSDLAKLNVPSGEVVLLD